MAMVLGQSLGVDPFHARDLAEARAEGFEQFREARSRFGEPLLRRGPDSRHSECGWRLAEAVGEAYRTRYVNRVVFPYGGRC